MYTNVKGSYVSMITATCPLNSVLHLMA